MKLIILFLSAGSTEWELQNKMGTLFQVKLWGDTASLPSTVTQPLSWEHFLPFLFSEKALLGQGNNAVLTLKNPGNQRSSKIAGVFQSASLQQWWTELPRRVRIKRKVAKTKTVFDRGGGSETTRRSIKPKKNWDTISFIRPNIYWILATNMPCTVIRIGDVTMSKT